MMTSPRGVGIAIAMLSSLALAGCDFFPDWLGDVEEPPLPGERISILALEQTIEPDPRISDLAVRLPRPYVNESWPQNGGYPDRAMHHLSTGETMSPIWEVDIGDGSGDDGRILSTPIMAGNRVFVVDAEGEISAFDAGTGDHLWSVEAIPEEDDEGGFAGGVAYAGDKLFATTGFGEVLALDPSDGATVWRQRIGIPVRAMPVVADGRVFVISYDNQLWALDTKDGRILWSNAGIAETAALMGAGSPAVDGDIVIAPYSSGELSAIRVENGRTVWSDSLGLQRPGMSGLAILNDINGSPVIDRGVAYVVSHGGRVVAIDVRTGNRVWEQDLSGLHTPWIAGDFLFLVTTEGDVVCIAARSGQVKWVRSLPRFEDPEDREDPIFWSGPVLVSDRLIVVGSNAEAVSISPYDGRFLGRMALPGGTRLPPIVADGTVFILTDDADLVALR